VLAVTFRLTCAAMNVAVVIGKVSQ
jgi:hypothetical protein